MPKYFYTAKKDDGETKSGILVAQNESALAGQLRTEGFLITSISPIEEKEKISVRFLDRFTTIPLKEKLFFTRNLSVMVASGLSVGRSLHNLSDQTENKRFRKVLEALYENVQKGTSFSDSLGKYPTIFDELFVNMVRVGEVGGSLEDVLKILTIQMEKEHELLSKVRGALIYPSVIVVAMIGVGIVMLTYILPTILSVFEDMEVTLPPTTRFVISLSSLLGSYGSVVLVALVLLAVAMKFWVQTESGRMARGFAALHIPILAGIVIKINCARFARIYSSLLRSGVSTVDALAIVSRTLTNHYYGSAVRESSMQIQKGVELSRAIGSYPHLFPVIMPQMIKVGEETGKTEAMLQKLAEFYEEEVSQITKNLSSIIEPVLMLFIGGSVGFFAVAMLQPMYSVLENIQ